MQTPLLFYLVYGYDFKKMCLAEPGQKLINVEMKHRLLILNFVENIKILLKLI